MPALTDPRYEKFAQVFALTGHAGNAAAEVGLARSYAWMVRNRPEVDARIQEIVAQRFAKASITAERVLKELARIGLSDVRDLYDPETGELVPMHELPDDAAAAVSRVETEVRGEGHGEDRTFFVVKKVRMHDKMAALGLLARHFKIVGEESDGVDALANALAARLKNARTRTVTPAEDAVILPHPEINGRRLEYALPDDPSDADDVSSPGLSLPEADPEALHSGHTPPDRESPHRPGPSFHAKPDEADHEDLR